MIPKKTFKHLGSQDFPPFLGDTTDRPCVVDNSDGAFTDCFGLGPYAVAGPKGREYSQGAGTIKGPGGNASGRGQTIRVKS